MAKEEDPIKIIKKSIFMRHLCLAFEKINSRWPTKEEIDELDKMVLADNDIEDSVYGAMEEYKDYCNKRDALVTNVSSPT